MRSILIHDSGAAVDEETRFIVINTSSSHQQTQAYSRATPDARGVP